MKEKNPMSYFVFRLLDYLNVPTFPSTPPTRAVQLGILVARGRLSVMLLFFISRFYRASNTHERSSR
jgi:hypothetical protein